MHFVKKSGRGQRKNTQPVDFAGDPEKNRISPIKSLFTGAKALDFTSGVLYNNNALVK